MLLIFFQFTSTLDYLTNIRLPYQWGLTFKKSSKNKTRIQKQKSISNLTNVPRTVKTQSLKGRTGRLKTQMTKNAQNTKRLNFKEINQDVKKIIKCE